VLRGAALLLPLGSTLACGGERKPAPPAAAETTTSQPDAELVVCDRDSDGHITEYHVLSAINHKLDTYPDFATAIGMTKVTDCEGARAFEASYRDYVAQNPGFDADEPRPAPPLAGAAPAGPRPELQVQKVQNGNLPTELGVYPNEAVVLLKPVDSPDSCTGTFIAKDWIATAGHCLVARAGSTDAHPPTDFTTNPIATGAPPASQLWGYDSWNIQWVGQGGLVTMTSLAPGVPVLQYPDPLYRGFSKSAGVNDSDHDFALLHLDSTSNDLNLPANPANGSAMAIATTAPDPMGPMTAAGFGPGGSTTLTIKTILSTVTRTLDADTVTVGNEPDPYPRLCDADSGGPLYRIVQDDNGVNHQVLLATYVGTLPGSGPPPTGKCSRANDSDVFRLLAPMNDYINLAMQQWNEKNFTCRTNDTFNFAECWGTPCTGTDDPACSDEETCADSHEVLDPVGIQTCPQCSPTFDPNASCDCIMGQCLNYGP
jgi:hypothetical protein